MANPLSKLLILLHFQTVKTTGSPILPHAFYFQNSLQMETVFSTSPPAWELRNYISPAESRKRDKKDCFPPRRKREQAKPLHADESPIARTAGKFLTLKLI